MDSSTYANLGALAIVSVFAVREFFSYLNKRTDKPDTTPPGRNGRAGDRSAEWWELTFSRIIKQCLDDHENKIRQPANREAQESREEIKVALRQIERQIALATAEVVRQIREGR